MWIAAVVAGGIIMLLSIFLISKSSELAQVERKYELLQSQYADSQRRLMATLKEMQTRGEQIKALRLKNKKLIREEEYEQRLAEYREEQSRPLRRLVRLPKPQESK